MQINRKFSYSKINAIEITIKFQRKNTSRFQQTWKHFFFSFMYKLEVCSILFLKLRIVCLIFFFIYYHVNIILASNVVFSKRKKKYRRKKFINGKSACMRTSKKNGANSKLTHQFHFHSDRIKVKYLFFFYHREKERLE